MCAFTDNGNNRNGNNHQGVPGSEEIDPGEGNMNIRDEDDNSGENVEAIQVMLISHSLPYL